jgi:hypothetical protein
MSTPTKEFLSRSPDEPLAIILCCLPVREAAQLALVDKAWCVATGTRRRELWMHLFLSLRLRPPSQLARRASHDLRTAFFVAWSQSRWSEPNINRLFNLVWTEFEQRDSPKALERLLPPKTGSTETSANTTSACESHAISQVGKKRKWQTPASHHPNAKTSTVHQERGFDINAQSVTIESNTLVNLAARFGRMRCVKWLVQHRGADVNIPGHYHDTVR